MLRHNSAKYEDVLNLGCTENRLSKMRDPDVSGQ